LVQSLLAYSTVYQVGPTRTYVSPNALYLASVVQTGDTIDIDAATYTGNASLAVWHPDSLLIRGVGGRPHLVANGSSIWGKGIWVLRGLNDIVENIEFSGAAVPSHNGAGIRLDGTGLTVRNCYFHDNENGILTGNPSAGDILIEYCEFNHNGYGSGFTHNLYIGHVNKLSFQFNYTHHANVGHNLKSRATENYILYNRIMDEGSGNSSRLIDVPNGGFCIIMGNLLMQGANAINNNLIGYGKEGLVNPAPHELYVVSNTLLNKRVASCLFVDIKPGTTVANVTNNIFTGAGTVIGGATTSMSHNLIEPTIFFVQFRSQINYDYDIKGTSPAIDYGTTLGSVNGHSLTPSFSYVHPESKRVRAVINGVIDAGAYESDDAIGVFVWDGGGDGLHWNDALNWIADVVPLDTSEVQINNVLDSVIIPAGFNA
ncbi:MAG: hypothetical protein KAG66_15110, partial [Methylococcales bacterium]|nr:hypothetical protein [Methylococcales bacterium]